MDKEKKRVCFITAIYGSYELTCKKFVEQTIPTDFICFTDNPNIVSNGWIIDNNAYHLTHKSQIDTDNYLNSIVNNHHTFNIAKYYKQAFYNIPRLKEYEAIVWLDGTIEIIYDKVSEYVLRNIYEHKIITWHHEYRFGNLEEEVKASLGGWRYDCTFFFNQHQPYQDIIAQYNAYLATGYTNEYFKNISNNPFFGVWLTCFVAFLNNDSCVVDFLNLWYQQTLVWSTQDQVGFPFCVQKMNFIPLTLPNEEVPGDAPHKQTLFYIKHNHNQ